ncbi:hypothetical protein V8E53_013249 [Lactarius tabidus]
MPGPYAVNLSSSFGAPFIGLIVCVGLYGLTLGQSWMYFWHYRNKDSKALKSFITCITILDTIHTAMIVYSMYWYLVLNFGNVEALAANKWFFTVQSNFGSSYTVPIQWYYVRQIYIVSQNIIPPIIILSMSLVGTGKCSYFPLAVTSKMSSLVSSEALGLYLMARQLAGGKVANASVSRFGDAVVERIEIFASADAIVVNILIAGFMCWALYRKKTGFGRTDSMIMTLMAYTIHTGLLTALGSTALTISLVIAPRSLIPMSIGNPLGKCYVNSLLAMLNSRGYVRSRGSPDNSDNSFRLTPIRVAPPSGAFGSKSKPTDISVLVRRSTALVDAQNESYPNMGRAFEVPKLDTSTIPQSQGRISASSM